MSDPFKSNLFPPAARAGHPGMPTVNLCSGPTGCAHHMKAVYDDRGRFERLHACAKHPGLKLRDARTLCRGQAGVWEPKP